MPLVPPGENGIVEADEFALEMMDWVGVTSKNTMVIPLCSVLSAFKLNAQKRFDFKKGVFFDFVGKLICPKFPTPLQSLYEFPDSFSTISLWQSPFFLKKRKLFLLLVNIVTQYLFPLFFYIINHISRISSEPDFLKPTQTPNQATKPNKFNLYRDESFRNSEVVEMDRCRISIEFVVVTSSSRLLHPLSVVSLPKAAIRLSADAVGSAGITGRFTSSAKAREWVWAPRTLGTALRTYFTRCLLLLFPRRYY